LITGRPEYVCKSVLSQSCNEVSTDSEQLAKAECALHKAGHTREDLMDIRFISTLTADDEGQMAPALMHAVTALLDALPIAYTLRIETLGSQVFQHTHPSASGGMVPIAAGDRRHADMIKPVELIR